MVLTVVALKIRVFLDVTLCQLVNNYRSFEHSHIVHEERLGLLGPEEDGTAMLRRTSFTSQHSVTSQKIYIQLQPRSKELSAFNGVGKTPFTPLHK